MDNIEHRIAKFINESLSEDEISNSEFLAKYLIEDIGWSNLPKGWTKKSVEKFAKSLADKGATKKGFFDACVSKMEGNIDDPEAFCASIKDEVWDTTFWRGKDKTKKEVEKQKKEENK
jgi:hypothetical protein